MRPPVSIEDRLAAAGLRHHHRCCDNTKQATGAAAGAAGRKENKESFIDCRRRLHAAPVSRQVTTSGCVSQCRMHARRLSAAGPGNGDGALYGSAVAAASVATLLLHGPPGVVETRTRLRGCLHYVRTCAAGPACIQAVVRRLSVHPPLTLLSWRQVHGSARLSVAGHVVVCCAV